MTYSVFIQAAAATYLISAIVFMIWTYIGAGERVERVMYALLWPIYLLLMAIAVLSGVINEISTSIIASIWPDDDEDDDFDEGGFA